MIFRLRIKLFAELAKIETLQEITLPSQYWIGLSSSDEWKKALDRSRVVQLGGLPLDFLDQLSAQVLQRLTFIEVYLYYFGLKIPLTHPQVPKLRPRPSAEAWQKLLSVTHLQDLVLGPSYDLTDYTRVLGIIGKLRNLQTLRLAFHLHYWALVIRI